MVFTIISDELLNRILQILEDNFFLAKRSVAVELGPFWDPAIIERAMLPLKFYHDFNCEIESYSYAFGPCWEPVIAQCNLSNAFHFINI